MRPSAARVVGFGRDDLSMAAQLGQIASALPEQRFLVWRLKAALASRGERERLRNAELCRVRELYPGMRGFRRLKGHRTAMDRLSSRRMGSR